MTLDNKTQASADARNVFADIIQQADNKTVFLLLVILTVSTSVGSAFMNVTGADASWWSGWLQNFSTEMMGAIATFLLFEGIIEARKRREDKNDAIDKEEKTLLLDFGGRDNAIALNALSKLRANPLFNDFLEKANLTEANLEKVDFEKANLEKVNLTGANLRHANFEKADLTGANFEKADLGWANLRHANLRHANLGKASLTGTDLGWASLRQASLRQASLAGASLVEANFAEANLEWASFAEANLRGANLRGANLSGVNLSEANLEGVNIYKVVCDEKTILPDGTNWTADTDWTTYGAVVIQTDF